MIAAVNNEHLIPYSLFQVSSRVREVGTRVVLAVESIHLRACMQPKASKYIYNAIFFCYIIMVFYLKIYLSALFSFEVLVGTDS